MLTSGYLQGTRITLRAIEPTDIDYLYQRENSSSVWHDGATIAPYSRQLLLEYIEQYTADIYRDRQLRLIITLTDCNRTIGIADLYDFDPRNSRAGIGIYIDHAYRCKGYGKETLHTISQYAFRFLGLHQLYAFIRTTNQPSQALFAACGFTHSATLPSWLLTPQGYTDVLVMQQINPSESQQPIP